jgi:hypothetical protein
MSGERKGTAVSRWESVGAVFAMIGTAIAYLLFAALAIGSLVLDFFIFMRYGFWGLVGLLAIETVVLPLCFMLLGVIGLGIAQGICALGRLCGLDWHID